MDVVAAVANRDAAGVSVSSLPGGSTPDQTADRLSAVEALGRRCYFSDMGNVAFDTLAMTHQLKAKGFSSDQAEATTEVVRAGVTGGVATKADLVEIRNDLLWMKRIGGVIVVLLAVPTQRDILSALN